MIEFYRPVDCAACSEIEQLLKEMVIAHKVVTVSADQTVAEIEGVPLPAFKERDRIISGQPDIEAYLKELQAFVTDWRRFQGDSCYCDE